MTTQLVSQYKTREPLALQFSIVQKWATQLSLLHANAMLFPAPIRRYLAIRTHFFSYCLENLRHALSLFDYGSEQPSVNDVKRTEYGQLFELPIEVIGQYVPTKENKIENIIGLINLFQTYSDKLIQSNHFNDPEKNYISICYRSVLDDLVAFIQELDQILDIKP